jgi:hypothetical protein
LFFHSLRSWFWRFFCLFFAWLRLFLYGFFGRSGGFLSLRRGATRWTARRGAWRATWRA